MMLKKLLALLCVVSLLTFGVSPVYAEQRITGCGFVDDDDCFAGGVKTESDT